MAQSRYNFSAGPSMLPSAVLAKAEAEFSNWQGTGSAVFEVSHRGKAFMAMMEKTEQDLRDLLCVPEGYKVLFLQGGATLQFTQVPLNLALANELVTYVDSGIWSQKAIKAAQKTQQVEILPGLRNEQHGKGLDLDVFQKVDVSSRYLHYCSNETIGGIQFPGSIAAPENAPDLPVVADMSSDFLSRPINVSDFGLIYAGAQKNFGPPGLVVVLIKEELLARSSEAIPDILNYQKLSQAESMMNTPPSFSCYMAGLVFAWLLEEGGLSHIAARNQEKATLLYDFIDSSEFYLNDIAPDYRSSMNVTFTLAKPDFEAAFLEQAEAVGLQQLKGHRSVGGFRASIYNAMPLAGVEALVNFMKDFDRAKK